jgi:hypothetical protein
VAYEDIILDLYSFADKCMAGDFDISSDPDIFLDLNEGANLTVVADRTAIEIHERKDSHIFAQLHIWSDSAKLSIP